MGKSSPEILKLSFEFSSKLGVRELPEFDPKTHESNVKGVYIVGDLADAPIIKVALNQGYDVARHVLATLPRRQGDADDEVLDVVVIGAGPAGIGAGLALQEAGARYVILEKERPFNTIQNFPKAKWVFAEPVSIENRGGFWFSDASKEALVDRWEQALDEKHLVIQQPEEVVEIQRQGDHFIVHSRVGSGGMLAGNTLKIPALQRNADGKNTYRARKVIMAIGRRGSVQKLGVPGEELSKVAYVLRDPELHKNRDVLVVGGGDSAVEAAMACAEAGARVTISYRQDSFSRAKLKNREKIEKLIAAGKIRAEYRSSPTEISPSSVKLKRGEEVVELPNDDVLVFIGTKLPRPFLERVGIRMAGAMDFWRAAWIILFALTTYLFYVLKHKKGYFPFGPDDLLGGVPDLLKVDLGFRSVDASFWGTCVYSVLILTFGIMAFRKYPMRQQKMRYVSLMVFQLVFLFGIPEIISPLVNWLGALDISRPWKFYAITVPWPLSIWSIIDAPSWAGGDSNAAIIWLVLGLLSAFVAIPIFVYFNGERFCSWLCGCGGLAETLGDRWRHLAPRGTTSHKAEWFGKIILVLAVPVTLMILNDAWGFIKSDALSNVQQFATQWYSLMVDFWLASVIGVAFYPYLGNRVWCRFFCPLRAWMEVLSRLFSRIAIDANDKCIGCGECTRFCQMGIPVQQFAQKQQQFHNGNSACIQCGICVQVCPMEVLSIGRRGVTIKKNLHDTLPTLDALER